MDHSIVTVDALSRLCVPWDQEKMIQVATMIKENLEELANEGIFPAFTIRVETDGSFTLDAKVTPAALC